MKISLPDGWVIDPLARARLEHQLTAAPAFVGSVVAPLTPLPPGASYRTVAEHLALRPLDAVQRHQRSADRPPGASVDRDLVHPDVASVVLVDTGTAAHDPNAIDRELLVAGSMAGSPFPRRPVVAFVGIDPAGPLLDRAHELTDALIGLDVEARLVVTTHPGGSHLTRPCLADLRSLQILRPQVLVVLDAQGNELAEAWCRQAWNATIVELDPAATTVAVRVGPGAAPGSPHRASIHPDVPPEELAGLFGRLVAGPQPGSPAEVEIRRPIRTTPPQPVRPPAAIRAVGLWAGVLDRAGQERFDGLASSIAAGGDRVVRGAPTADASRLVEGVDLLVLRGVVASPDLLELVTRRRRAARPTIIDLGADDLGTTGEAFGLSTDSLPLVEAARLVSTPSEAWCTELRAAGFAAHRLPTLRPAAPGPAAPHALHRPGAITWVLDPVERPPASAAAVGQTFRTVLERRPECRVIVCGDPRWWPPDLGTGAAVAFQTPGPDAALLAETTLLLWTPDRRRSSATGVPLWLLRAAEEGVPTLVDRHGPDDTRGLVPPGATVDRSNEPEQWLATLEWLLDDDIALQALREDARRLARASVSADLHHRCVQDLLAWALTSAHELAETGGAP